MQPVKVAILGAGFISDIHFESYHRFVANAEVVAVYTRDLQKAKAFAEKHQIPQYYDSVDDCIERSGCDVVDICLPNYLHAEATLKAAAAGTGAIGRHQLLRDQQRHRQWRQSRRSRRGR